MNHSSSNTGSMLSNILALAPTTPVAKGTSPAATSENVSFKNTYQDLRQQAADQTTLRNASQVRAKQQLAQQNTASRKLQNEQAADSVRQADAKKLMDASRARAATDVRQQQETHNKKTAASSKPVATETMSARASVTKAGNKLKTSSDQTTSADKFPRDNLPKSDTTKEELTAAGASVMNIESPLEQDKVDIDTVFMLAPSLSDPNESITISGLGVSEPALTADADTLLSELSDEQVSLTDDALLASQLAASDTTTLVSASSELGITGTTPVINQEGQVTKLEMSTLMSARSGESPAVNNSLNLGQPALDSDQAGDSDQLTLLSLGQEKGAITTSQKESFASLLTGQGEAKSLTQTGSQTQTSLAATDSVVRNMESLLPAGRNFVVQTGVPTSLGHPQWSQGVGDRVLWLAAQNVSSAELRLDPPELGPMQVRVTVHHDQVHVNFTSAHAVVREALDQGAQRLREMFQEQGMSLNVEVSDHQAHEQSDGQSSGRGKSGANDDVAEDDLPVTTLLKPMRLIDHYA